MCPASGGGSGQHLARPGAPPSLDPKLQCGVCVCVYVCVCVCGVCVCVFVCVCVCMRPTCCRQDVTYPCAPGTIRQVRESCVSQVKLVFQQRRIALHLSQAESGFSTLTGHAAMPCPVPESCRRLAAKVAHPRSLRHHPDLSPFPSSHRCQRGPWSGMRSGGASGRHWLLHVQLLAPH